MKINMDSWMACLSDQARIGMDFGSFAWLGGQKKSLRDKGLDLLVGRVGASLWLKPTR